MDRNRRKERKQNREIDRNDQKPEKGEETKQRNRQKWSDTKGNSKRGDSVGGARESKQDKGKTTKREIKTGDRNERWRRGRGKESEKGKT